MRDWLVVFVNNNSALSEYTDIKEVQSVRIRAEREMDIPSILYDISSNFEIIEIREF